MNYIIGTPRKQLVLFNNCLDEMIQKDSPVRFIDLYVDNLDLFELGFKIPELRTGAPPFNPSLLLKIYIYCYFEKIRSSRNMEKECQRNQELIWLTCNLAPDFKTIADFRKNNKKGLKNIFIEFLKLCRKLDLLSLKLTAADGTKIRAQNGNNEVYKRNTIADKQKNIETQIEEYINKLNENDREENEEIELNKEETGKLLKKIKKLKKLETKVGIIKGMFESDDSLEKIFATDPDSRFQSDKGQVAPGYNAQLCSDSKNKLIVANYISNESNDTHQISSMVKELKGIKEKLEIKEKTSMVMDAGYHNETEIMKNKDDNEIDILVQSRMDARKKNKREKRIKKRENKNKVPSYEFELKYFKHDKEQDVYICPLGQKLKKTNKKPKSDKTGRKMNVYRCINFKNCKSRYYCTKNSKGRVIEISVNTEKMRKYFESLKSKNNKMKLSKRKEIVEHPFGTIKRNWGFTSFMQRGIKKVEAEFNFICFIYNLKRVLNLVTIQNLFRVLESE